MEDSNWPEPAPPAPPSGRIHQVDGLRGLAIFLVLVWHYVPVALANLPSSRAAPLSLVLAPLQLTWSGVDLFFVLSGFLIGGILIDARESPGYFKAFYARRFFRIIPLYAAICVVYALAVRAGGERWWGSAGPWLFAHPIPWYAFPCFLQNFVIALRAHFDPPPLGITWSLAVEEQFYLTLPLLVRFVPRRRLAPVLVAIVLAVPFLRAAMFFRWPHAGVAIYVTMLTRSDSLLMGVLVALLVRSPAAWAVLVRRRARLIWGACLLAAGAIVCIRYGCTNNASGVISTVGYSGLALFYALVLVLALTRETGLLSRALRTGWLRALGEIAYGTYLFHVAVLGVVFGVLAGRAPEITRWSDLRFIALSAALTIGLALVSWNVFEKRLVRFGHRFGYERPPAPGAGHAPSTSLPER